MKEHSGHEFKELLDHLLNDDPGIEHENENENETLDELRILLPKHGRFWDNGHEDIE